LKVIDFIVEYYLIILVILLLIILYIIGYVVWLEYENLDEATKRAIQNFT